MPSNVLSVFQLTIALNPHHNLFIIILFPGICQLFAIRDRVMGVFLSFLSFLFFVQPLQQARQGKQQERRKSAAAGRTSKMRWRRCSQVLRALKPESQGSTFLIARNTKEIVSLTKR